MFSSRLLSRFRPRIKLIARSGPSYIQTLGTDSFIEPGRVKPIFINKCFSTESRLLESKGVENTFAYGIVKTAGIAVIEEKCDFTILERIASSNGAKHVLDELSTEITKLSDSQLVALLDHLQPLQETAYFNDLWKIIDLEGSKRIPKGDPTVVLAGAMKIYLLQLNWRSEWIWSCLKRFCRRLDRLNKSEMLQVMFLLNLSRKIPAQYSGFDLQFHLVNHFEELNLSEMALVSLAFFKSETKITNKAVMSSIMRQMIDEAASSSGLTLAMLAKIIRYSMPLTLADELLVVQSRLIEEIPRLELKSLTHLALIGTNALVYHKQYISAIINQLKANISEIRLKDLERILFVMSLFYHKDDEFVEQILKEVSGRHEEIEAYPKPFINLLGFAAVMEHFPLDLIDRALSNKFLNETYSKVSSLRKQGNELIYLDKTIEVERPDYTGNRLSVKLVKQSAKIVKFTATSQITGTQKFSFELEGVLNQIYGENRVVYMAVLPQYHFADFVVGFDKNFKAQPIPADWAVHQWGEVKPLPDDENLWFVIIHGGWNSLIRNTDEPLGMTRAKMRQLRKLGYHPVIIPYNSWRESTDKRKLVQGIIEEELERVGKVNKTAASKG